MKRLFAFAAAAAMLLCGCHRGEEPALVPKESTGPRETLAVSQAAPLLFLTDDPAEAQKIAQLYNIRLLSHEDGLAVYATDEDPREVIRRGEKNGWPELSLNQIYDLY